MPKNVDPALALRLDAGTLQEVHRLVSGQLSAAGQRACQQVAAQRERGTIDPELTKPVCACSDDARRQQPENPANVCPGHEVQSAAHRPRAHDGSACQRPLDVGLAGVRQTKTDCPQGAPVVLGLHGSEHGHHFLRRCAGAYRDLLIRQPKSGYVEGGQRADRLPSSDRKTPLMCIASHVTRLRSQPLRQLPAP